MLSELSVLSFLCENAPVLFQITLVLYWLLYGRNIAEPVIFGSPASTVVLTGWAVDAPIKVLSSAIFSHVPLYNPAGSTSDVDKKIQLFT